MAFSDLLSVLSWAQNYAVIYRTTFSMSRGEAIVPSPPYRSSHSTAPHTNGYLSTIVLSQAKNRENQAWFIEWKIHSTMQITFFSNKSV